LFIVEDAKNKQAKLPEIAPNVQPIGGYLLLTLCSGQCGGQIGSQRLPTV